ncbi:glutaredoxin family protein, partial [Candidatus Woesebacteria bacterium]|nr:glutaredoxin family protein [Candidatus Woesebacteria bacterium]
MSDVTIKFYGAGWCGDCVRSKKLLDEHNISYEYFDTDAKPEYAQAVEKINKGQRRIPTIVFSDGVILV